ncbi:discoidin domain-containing protein [Aquisphaera insulae]|uniref:discoidin domain-containing protein n=1 Tax=Aquisphaera insulae TaxID=2712864 RepID=UPI0013ECC6D4|nr:discoidin domain-containing protein [Aquisphaera insulae]
MNSRSIAVACALALVGLFGPSEIRAAEGSRRTIVLDGTWQIAEGTMDAPPARFARTAQVPGLASNAVPPFESPPGPRVADRRAFPQKDPNRDAFWYRRTFRVDGPLPAIARLKVRQAMFGSKVILNGRDLGVHAACFTPGYFEARPALREGENEILIRVGADRAAVGPGVPSGFDYEKERYIPGLVDSVELILSGTPHVLSVQAAPDVASWSVRVQAILRNDGPAATARVSFTVREAVSGKAVGRAEASPREVPAGAEISLDARVPLESCRPWSPEDPFLYVLEADAGADSVRTRFGMREFRLDGPTGRAMLNGRPYFLRGSNITLYRFYEDPECKGLPWDERWVRTLHQRIKGMHWNSLRYCIGLAPERWYDLADELGILIQDEFPVWHGGDGWSTWPRELGRDELAREYAEWIRERWNHPSVVIWDASNETKHAELSAAVERVRGLDLSDRPWDNSYNPPARPGDAFESHPYHFQDPAFRLADVATSDQVPQGSPLHNDGQHAVIINEYGWLWLNRDGTPTTLTNRLYANLLGEHANVTALRRTYARYLAAETEFWRSHRHAAGVLHFTALGYSRPDGQTSDHWLDVTRLEWEPEFVRYVRDAFAPVGLMIDAWADDELVGEHRSIPVAVINDLDRPWRGEVRFRLLHDGKAEHEQGRELIVPALGRATTAFTLSLPAEPGEYELEASLLGSDGDPVRSVRDLRVVTPEQRRARLGLALGKPATASSNLARDGATSPAAAFDGRPDSRWSSEFSDPQWLAVDLGGIGRISRVELLWDPAFGKSYAIELSADGKTWSEVYRTDSGQGGTEVIRFTPAGARWVRYVGKARGTNYGHSIREFRVFP